MIIRLLFIFTFIHFLSIGQGVEFLSPDEYKSIAAPQTLTGGSAGMGIPEKYIIPEAAFPIPRNQGEQPSCTAWATGFGFMSFYQGCKNGWSLKEDQNIFSPSYIYQNIKGTGSCATCKCGTYISDALNYLKNTGVVPITKFPYNDKQCIMPSSELTKVANNYKIKNWYRVKDVHNFTELKNFLSQDMPVIIACYTDKAFSEFYNKKETDTFFWKSGPDKGGNHAMLLVGYDNNRNAFKIMNSWGPNFGHNGFVWVDYESFRIMLAEAYVVEKDYELTINTDVVDNTEVNVDVKPVNHNNQVFIETSSDLDYNYFELYGYKDEISSNRYHFNFGFMIDDAVAHLVDKVVYVYDDPSFTNKYFTASTGPNYTTSYEGWGCLNKMQAVIYFKDGTTMAYEYDACELIEDYEVYDWEYEVAITPVVSVTETETPDVLNFTIELYGIETIKDQVEKVVYDLNHSSFKNRYQTITDGHNNFAGGYFGWGCLREVIIYIYYKDGTYETTSVDLCNELGW